MIMNWLQPCHYELNMLPSVTFSLVSTRSSRPDFSAGPCRTVSLGTVLDYCTSSVVVWYYTTLQC